MQASNDHTLSGSLLANWQVAEQAMVYAQWTQGFKATDATQLYMNYGAEGSYLRLGNAGLKPQESNGYEIGLELGNAKLGGSLSLFDNHYKSFIDDDVAINAADLAAVALDGVKLQAGLFNLFDKKYWNALNVPTSALVQPDDYYSEAGRSLRVSAAWQY